MRGILYMCLATVLLFPSLNAIVKYLGSEYSVWEVIWARSLGHMLVMIALCAPGRGVIRVFASRRPLLQLARSALQVGAMFCFLIALTHIPLATVTVIIFTAPLLVVALSVPLLGERVGPRRWLAVIVGFIGALIIIRPGAQVVHWATFLALGSVCFYALFQILTRKLAAYDDTRTTAVYTVIMPLIVSSGIAPFDLAMPTGGLDWLLFVGLAVTGGLSHYFLIKAYETGEASVISPFDYGQMIGATVLGYLIWRDFPDVWTWVGTGVIVASGLYVAHRETRRAPSP